MNTEEKGRIYDYPSYYELAFSFRDIPREVDTFERCIGLFSKIPVRTMLELGCGPAPHMIEILRRGYEYVGIDLSEKMLDFARTRADQARLSPSLIKGNMVDFDLRSNVDFAFVLLGSLYVADTAELLCHLRSVARALNPGGTYLLDWCVQFDRSLEESDSWVIEREALRIDISNSWRCVDPAGQTFEEIIEMTVKDHGSDYHLCERHLRRAIYPQEFILMVEKTGCFEFMGSWNNWNLDDSLVEGTTLAPDDRIERPITLIRRV